MPLPQSWLVKGSSALLGKSLQHHQYVQFTTGYQHFAKRWKEKSVPAYTSRWMPQYNLLPSKFDTQVFESSERRCWNEGSSPWQNWNDVSSSHFRTWLALLEIFIMVFAVQVRFKTTQVESGEIWALCLVRLWPRKNSTASVWWNLWGIQKIFKVRREESQLLTTLSQNLNFRKLVKTGPVEYIAPETKEVVTNHWLD